MVNKKNFVISLTVVLLSIAIIAGFASTGSSKVVKIQFLSDDIISPKKNIDLKGDQFFELEKISEIIKSYEFFKRFNPSSNYFLYVIERNVITNYQRSEITLILPDTENYKVFLSTFNNNLEQSLSNLKLPTKNEDLTLFNNLIYENNSIWTVTTQYEEASLSSTGILTKFSILLCSLLLLFLKYEN